jgi:hypothetical protein
MGKPTLPKRQPTPGDAPPVKSVPAVKAASRPSLLAEALRSTSGRMPVGRGMLG